MAFGVLKAIAVGKLVDRDTGQPVQVQNPDAKFDKVSYVIKKERYHKPKKRKPIVHHRKTTKKKSKR
jgi:hypothetical protein